MTFECKQAININLTFFGETVPVTAYLSPRLPYDLILGYHFLVKNRFVIDFETMQITKKSESQVKLLNAVSLTPMSESVVQAYLKDNIDGNTGLITGSELANNAGLLAANTLGALSENSPVVPVKLLNLSMEHISLPQHFSVGSCEAISSEKIFEQNNRSAQKPKAQRKPSKDREKFLDQFVFDSASDPQNVAQLKQLLWEYNDIFPGKNEPLGCTNLVEFEISLRPDAKPLKARPYRSNPKTRREIKKHIEQMLKEDIIRPSTSNYVSPVLLVQKADGSLRFVTDFRRNNLQNIGIHIIRIIRTVPLASSLLLQ